jgi:hypothetical protein
VPILVRRQFRTYLTACIGFEGAHQLAALQPRRLILGVRDMKYGGEALDSVLKAHPGTTANVWSLGLGSL